MRNAKFKAMRFGIVSEIIIWQTTVWDFRSLQAIVGFSELSSLWLNNQNIFLLGVEISLVTTRNRVEFIRVSNLIIIRVRIIGSISFSISLRNRRSIARLLTYFIKRFLFFYITCWDTISPRNRFIGLLEIV